MIYRTVTAFILLLAFVTGCAKEDPPPPLSGVFQCMKEPPDSGALNPKKWYICRVYLGAKPTTPGPRNVKWQMGVAANSTTEAEGKVRVYFQGPNPDASKYNLNYVLCVPAAPGWAPTPGTRPLSDDDNLCVADPNDFHIQGCDFTSIVNSCTENGTPDCPQECVESDAGVGECVGIPAFAGACSANTSTGSGQPECAHEGDFCDVSTPCCDPVNDNCSLNYCQLRGPVPVHEPEDALDAGADAPE